MLLSKDAIADVVEVVRATDFYKPAHQTIFDVVVDLYGKGEPADPITVSAELTRLGEIGRVGGAPYLHTLLSSVPTAANAGFYASIVQEQAVLRRLVEAGTRIVQLGYGASGTRRGRRHRRPCAAGHLRRHRAAVVGGLHAARAAHAAHDGRARGHRQPGRVDVRRADRLRRPRRAHQRSARRPAHRHRRPARSRQGPGARHPAADAHRLDDDGRRRRRGLPARRAGPSHPGGRGDGGAARTSLLRGLVLRRHDGRCRRRAPVADEHPRCPPLRRWPAGGPHHEAARRDGPLPDR